MVPLWRTAGSPINPASSASAGIASPTTAEVATAWWVAVAPITSDRPFISMPSRPSMWERSTRCGGLASRCFMTGSSVWPPAITLASSFLIRRLAACRTVSGRWYLNSYIDIPWMSPDGCVRRLSEVGLGHRLGAGGDRQHDILITSAAAQVAFELLADGVDGEIVALAVDDIDRGHDHAGGAETAFQSGILAEGFLHRIQGPAIDRQPFDRTDLVPVRHHRQRGAGFDRSAVEMHDAGAALRGIAADMGTGEPQIFAQELHQKRAGIDIGVNGISVHNQGDFRHLRALFINADATRRRSHFRCFRAIIWAIPAMSNLIAAWLGRDRTQTGTARKAAI